MINYNDRTFANRAGYDGGEIKTSSEQEAFDYLCGRLDRMTEEANKSLAILDNRLRLLEGAKEK